ncbi:MAG: type II secretion system F family protein [Candidatus Cloacimonadaceae bacterium]
MAKEYRFKGVNPEGRPAQGTFMASSKKEAKEQLSKITLRYKLKIQTFEAKKDWLYSIKLPNKKKITGRQSAYTKEEVAAALTRMGHKDFNISPVLFDIPSKPSLPDVMMFIKLSATMLRDKMSFGKILEMLAEEQSNRGFREALLQIESQLRGGAEGREVFNRYSHIFGKFPSYMLGLATRSGNMAEIFEATALFMERDMEIKKNIRSALVTPLFALAATIGATVYYIVDIFPATAELFLDYDMPLPPLTDKTLQASYWLSSYWWIILLIVVIPVIIIWRWWSTPKGRIWKDKNLVKLPLIGHLLHKSAIETYFRVFSIIYGGAADNIETIRTAAEACRNAWMEDRIKRITIPLMLKDGVGLVEAMTASEVFTKTALTRIRTGQETGTILQSAQQIATFYEAETTYKMNNLVEYIQTIVGMVVALAITFLTVVSAEIATVSPPTH